MYQNIDLSMLTFGMDPFKTKMFEVVIVVVKLNFLLFLCCCVVVFKAVYQDICSFLNPIPPGGAQSARTTFNFLRSWQFLVFFLDFLGEFLKSILVLEFK